MLAILTIWGNSVTVVGIVVVDVACRVDIANIVAVAAVGRAQEKYLQLLPL